MAIPLFEPLSRAEIESLAERTFDWIIATDTLDDIHMSTENSRTLNERIARARATLRFCAMAAGLLRDPALLPLVVRIAGFVAGYDDDYYTPFQAVAAALSSLLRVAPSPECAAHLAAYDDVQVREAIARGLRPETKPGHALLEVLADDPVAAVRNAARASLETQGSVAWWRGIFRGDPTEGMGDTEAAAIKPNLEEIVKLVGLSEFKLAKSDLHAPARRVGRVSVDRPRRGQPREASVDAPR